MKTYRVWSALLLIISLQFSGVTLGEERELPAQQVMEQAPFELGDAKGSETYTPENKTSKNDASTVVIEGVRDIEMPQETIVEGDGAETRKEKAAEPVTVTEEETEAVPEEYAGMLLEPTEMPESNDEPHNSEEQTDDPIKDGDTREVDGVTYRISGGEATVISVDKELEEVTIPSEIGGFPVTRIEACAFAHFIYYDGYDEYEEYYEDHTEYIEGFGINDVLKNVTLSDNMRDISGAFINCTALEAVNLQNGISNASGAFAYCEALKEINLPESVTSIEPLSIEYLTEDPMESEYDIEKLIASKVFGTFVGCKNLKSVSISGSVSNMKYAFKDCVSLESITIPKGTKNISHAFEGCKKLSSVTMSDGIDDMSYAFKNCELLRTIKVHSSNNIDFAFENCKSLETITLCNGLTSMKCAFTGCESLKKIEIPNSVTDISGAFYGCKSLEKIKLPDKLVSFGCMERRTSTVERHYDSNYEKIYETNEYEQRGTFEGCSSLKEITIPKTAIQIEDSTFKDCASLKSIVIPSHVTTIGEFAFLGCDALEKVTLKSGVQSIKDYAFLGCNSLKEIYIPTSVNDIGADAFTDAVIDEKWSVHKCEEIWDDVDSEYFPWIITVDRTWVIRVDSDTACLLDLKIHGKWGSFAQEYAEKMSIPFDGGKKISAKKVTITKGKSATVYMGNKLTLNTVIKPANAYNKLKWTSSNPAIATVNEKGVVTPKSAGKATITVKTDNNKSAKITIKVVDASRVKLKEGSKATLKAGKTLTLHPAVSPLKVKTTFKYKSRDKRIATVSKTGVVKARKKGITTITVTTANGKTASIVINVK